MRNKRLDILRCLAVFLVMLNHGGILPFIARVGWAGVDLFFVLSGFLISGLLFSEYKTRGSISFKRFFIRRGLRIYPAFYLFLLLTGVISFLVLHTVTSVSHYIQDIFFVQNYWHGVWDHTWTLGVEEHFYLFLPILLISLVRLSRDQEDPFRAIPWIFLTVAVVCMALRGVSVYWGEPNYNAAYRATHERMDSLFFGALLGYFYHFRPLVLEDLLQSARNRLVVAVCSASLLSIVFFFPRENKFFSTFGYSCLYLGFGGVLLLSLYMQGVARCKIARFLEAIGAAAATVGMYSYSIYLWHGPTNALFPGFVRRVVHLSSFAPVGRFVVYFVGSLAIGIMMSKIIEYPILRLRDRIFPARQGTVVSPSGNSKPTGTATSNRGEASPAAGIVSNQSVEL